MSRDPDRNFEPLDPGGSWMRLASNQRGTDMTYDEIYERARHGINCAFHQMRYGDISSDTLRDCEIMHVRGLARARGAKPAQVQHEINQLWEGNQL